MLVVSLWAIMGRVLLQYMQYHNLKVASFQSLDIWCRHVVTKSDRWVSSEYYGFLLLVEHTNANIVTNEHEMYKLYNVFR